MMDLSVQHVSRLFILPAQSFDYLKRYQRALQARTGQPCNNSQVIAQILAEHEEYLGLTGKPSVHHRAALLSPSVGHNQGGRE